MKITALIQCLQQVLAKAGDLDVVVSTQLGDRLVDDVIVGLNTGPKPGQAQAIIHHLPPGEKHG